MPTNRGFGFISIQDTGSNISLDSTEIQDSYLVQIAPGNSGNLGGHVTISASSSGSLCDTYVLVFKDVFVKNAFTFEVFGESISAAQLLTKPVVIVKDNGSSGYNVYLQANFNGEVVETDNIVDGAVTFDKMQGLTRGAMIVGDSLGRPAAKDVSGAGRFPLGDGTDTNAVAMSGDATMDGTGAVTIANDAVDNNKLANISRGFIKVGGVSNAPTDLDAKTNGYILVGDGTDLNSVGVSGDITLTNAGLVTIGNDKITTVKILDANVTVAKLEANLQTEVITVPVSFETGEQCDNRVKIPYDCTVNEIYAVVTKAIAGTDDATITAKNGAGTTMTDGVITFSASDPLETAETAIPTANNTVSDGDAIYLTTAKSTAGGKALVSIKITKT
jgi:hypothetical protein